MSNTPKTPPTPAAFPVQNTPPVVPQFLAPVQSKVITGPTPSGQAVQMTINSPTFTPPRIRATTSAAAVDKGARSTTTDTDSTSPKIVGLSPDTIETILDGLRSGTQFKPNPLDDFYNVAPNFRLFCTPDRDAVLMNGSVPTTVQAYYDLIDKFTQVTIAQSGVTGFNIKSVSVENMVGPNFRTRAINTTAITMTIVEANGVKFLDALKNATKYVGTRNFQKCWYFLELRFRGYDSTGKGTNQPLESSQFKNGGRWIWQVQITDIETQLSTAGGEYKLTMVPYAEATLEQQYVCTPETIIADGNTVKELFDDFKTQLNLAWFERNGNDPEGTKYDFVFHDVKVRNMSKSYIENISLIPKKPGLSPVTDQAMAADAASTDDTPASGTPTVGTAPAASDAPDPEIKISNLSGKPRAHIARGMNMTDVVNMVFANSEIGQQLAKDSTADDTSPDDAKGKVNDRGYRETLVFRAEPEVRVVGYDPMFGTYRKQIVFHIYGYVTQRAIMSKQQIIDARDAKVQQKMLAGIAKPGLLNKAYNYLFTGKNTDILDLNLSYNLLWGAVLPKLIRDEALAIHAEYDKDEIEKTLQNKIDVVEALRSASEAYNAALDTATDNQKDPSSASAEDIANTQKELANKKAAYDAAAAAVAAERKKEATYLPKFDGALLNNKARVYIEAVDPSTLPVTGIDQLSLSVAGDEVKNSIANGMRGQYHPGKTIYGAVLNQLHGPLTSQFINISMKTRGDPYWIGPGNLEAQVNRVHDLDEMDSKSPAFANYTLGDNMFLLNFSYPLGTDDYGNVTLSKNEIFTGLYHVTKVVHDFTDGQFTQTLEALRMPLVDVFRALDQKNTSGVSN